MEYQSELEKLILKYPEKPWDWEWISQNPNITMEMIEKYPEKSWNWEWISQNPNITMEMIEKYPEKPWNWDWISMNTFNWKTKKTNKKLSNLIINENLRNNVIEII